MKNGFAPVATLWPRLRALKAQFRDPEQRKILAKTSFKLFVVYHIIKGTITTVFIWLPLLFLWLQGR